MKWLLPLIAAISFGCMQVEQGAAESDRKDILLGEWVSLPAGVFETQEPIHLTFNSDGSALKKQKGEKDRSYSYTREPFSAWASKENAFESIGAQPGDPTWQEVFEEPVEVVTLTRDSSTADPSLVLILQANRSLIGFKPNNVRLSPEVVFIRLEVKQKADVEKFAPDDFSTATLLEPYTERGKAVTIGLRTSLEVEDAFLDVELSLPDRFSASTDGKRDRVVSLGGKATVTAHVVELSEEGAKNLRASQKASYTESRTAVEPEQGARTEMTRVKTAENWLGYVEDNKLDEGSSLTYRLFRGNRYFAVTFSASVPSSAIRKDADRFVATLSKAIGMDRPIH